uniref:Gag-Pol polyprotein n=1 Tax=Sparus aurata TaxID=8175 RepID=A0A671WVG1_SPAAU
MQPQTEPTIEVTVQNRQHHFMVDTGATHSCIGKEGAGLPLSSAKIRTVGFSGKTQIIPMTEPVPMTIAGRTIYAPLLYSVDTPINLLGRDILCALQARIMCTPDGLHFDLPEENLQTIMAPVMERHMVTKEAHVYWMKITSPNSFLQQDWETWKLFVAHYYEAAQEPTLPLHCTMMYDADGEQEDYDACWNELINHTTAVIQYEDIIMGPQGTAAAVRLTEEVKEWFQDPKSSPHVTLLVAAGHESHELGPMIKEAQQIQEWIPTDSQYVHSSPDGRFLRISYKRADEAIAEKVLLPTEVKSQMLLTKDQEVLLSQVPPHVWSAHKTDVGLVKSATPQRFQIKTGIHLPYQKQYPLRQEAINGIKPTIEGLLEAGVLIKTKSPCNTPIFPIRKLNSNDYRLVHDLRAINSIVTEEIPIVPDPHTLLSNIPPETKWYTVIDLCSAFFSVPIHPESQYLFAFTYEGQQYTYSRLPQGFVHSPSIFNKVLAEDLQHLNVQSTTLMYVDDILICSDSKEQCEKDSITVLKALAAGGHKVSKSKLQFCQQTVEYLGRQLSGNKRQIAPSQVEAVTKAPKPQTVGQMLSFLGMTGYSRPWICDYSIKTAPMRALIRAAGQTNRSAKLNWTEEAEKAFFLLKTDMQTAPALATPDYSKPFHLYAAERQGYACAVLMQESPTGKQPLAYYSTRLDNVEEGLPPCYQGLAAAAFAYKKPSVLTMGHPVTLYTSHQLHAMLTSPRFVLTQARRTGYEVLLSGTELTIQRCSTINPATRMVATDGIPHDCLKETDSFMKIREKLYNQPIPSELTLFVDGSCVRGDGGNCAGYGVVQLNPDNTFTKLLSVRLDQPCSAQLAEIKALTAACKLAAEKRATIYTDSAYGYGVCHINASIWKQRGFVRADGTPVVHGQAVSELIQAIQLPTELAIVKCPAHQTNDSLVAIGNNLADEAAKEATGQVTQAPVLSDQDCVPLTSLTSLIEAQNQVPGAEKCLWTQRGAIRTVTPHEGLWRSSDGHFVLPLSLLKIAIKKMHEPDHCSRAQVLRKLQAVWWSPYMTAMVDRELAICVHCPKYNIRKSFTHPLAHIPVPEGPFRHLMMDYVDMLDRVQGKRYMFVVICRFSRWVEACPTSRNDHKAAARFLCTEVFPRFGMPDTISSDSGPHFVSSVIKEMFKVLGIQQKFGCVYHPQSQGSVERANGVLKTKIAKIMADSNGKLTWIDALPLALMSMCSQTNRLTHLTPHEMLTGRPMPLPQCRGPIEGPSLQQLEQELGDYLRGLTQIHRLVFQQVKEANKGDDKGIPVDARETQVGDQVFIRVFRRHWHEPRREGPFKVVLTTPSALKVEGKNFWYHRNHCTRHQPPDPPGHLPEHAEGAAKGTPRTTTPNEGEAKSTPRRAIPGPAASPQGERRSARLRARREGTPSSRTNNSVGAAAKEDAANTATGSDTPDSASAGPLGPQETDCTPMLEGTVSDSD